MTGDKESDAEHLQGASSVVMQGRMAAAQEVGFAGVESERRPRTEPAFRVCSYGAGGSVIVAELDALDGPDAGALSAGYPGTLVAFDRAGRAYRCTGAERAPFFEATQWPPVAPSRPVSSDAPVNPRGWPWQTPAARQRRRTTPGIPDETALEAASSEAIKRIELGRDPRPESLRDFPKRDVPLAYCAVCAARGEPQRAWSEHWRLVPRRRLSAVSVAGRRSAPPVPKWMHDLLEKDVVLATVPRLVGPTVVPSSTIGVAHLEPQPLPAMFDAGGTWLWRRSNAPWTAPAPVGGPMVVHRPHGLTCSCDVTCHCFKVTEHRPDERPPARGRLLVDGEQPGQPWRRKKGQPVEFSDAEAQRLFKGRSRKDGSIAFGDELRLRATEAERAWLEALPEEDRTVLTAMVPASEEQGHGDKCPLFRRQGDKGVAKCDKSLGEAHGKGCWYPKAKQVDGGKCSCEPDELVQLPAPPLEDHFARTVRGKRRATRDDGQGCHWAAGPSYQRPPATIYKPLDEGRAVDRYGDFRIRDRSRGENDDPPTLLRKGVVGAISSGGKRWGVMLANRSGDDLAAVAVSVALNAKLACIAYANRCEDPSFDARNSKAPDVNPMDLHAGPLPKGTGYGSGRAHPVDMFADVWRYVESCGLARDVPPWLTTELLVWMREVVAPEDARGAGGQIARRDLETLFRQPEELALAVKRYGDMLAARAARKLHGDALEVADNARELFNGLACRVDPFLAIRGAAPERRDRGDERFGHPEDRARWIEWIFVDAGRRANANRKAPVRLDEEDLRYGETGLVASSDDYGARFNWTEPAGMPQNKGSVVGIYREWDRARDGALSLDRKIDDRASAPDDFFVYGAATRKAPPKTYSKPSKRWLDPGGWTLNAADFSALVRRTLEGCYHATRDALERGWLPWDERGCVSRRDPLWTGLGTDGGAGQRLGGRRAVACPHEHHTWRTEREADPQPGTAEQWQDRIEANDARGVAAVLGLVGELAAFLHVPALLARPANDGRVRAEHDAERGRYEGMRVNPPSIASFYEWRAYGISSMWDVPVRPAKSEQERARRIGELPVVPILRPAPETPHVDATLPASWGAPFHRDLARWASRVVPRADWWIDVPTTVLPVEGAFEETPLGHRPRTYGWSEWRDGAWHNETEEPAEKPPVPCTASISRARIEWDGSVPWFFLR